jgi:hypothetical protein
MRCKRGCCTAQEYVGAGGEVVRLRGSSRMGLGLGGGPEGGQPGLSPEP